MFMYDLSGTGRSPGGALIPPPALLWKYKTGGPITASPIIAQNTVFIGSHDGIFYALDAERWGERWRYDTGLPIRYSAAFWDGKIYFTASGRGICRLYALDARSGEELWQFELPTWTVSAPRAYRGTIYVGAYEAKIYLLDALTGEIRGERNTRTRIGNVDYVCLQGNLQPYPPAHMPDTWKEKLPYSTSLPVEANGIVYVGASDGKLYALEKLSWDKRWEFTARGPIESPAAIVRERLFFGSRDGYVYALGSRVRGEETSPAVPTTDGLVTHNLAPIYAEPSLDAPVQFHLNDGVRLPILEIRGSWYAVRLPNGTSGWMHSDDFARFVGEESMTYNQTLVGTVATLDLPEGAESPVWSPDGTRVAFLKRLNLSGQFWSANELWTMDYARQQFRKICVGLFYNSNLSWSLDSKWLAFETTEADTAYVWVAQVNGYELNRLARGDAPSFSPRAHRIVFRLWEDGDDELWVTTINGTGLKKVYEVPIEGVVRQFTFLEPPIWSPDGQLIAFGVDGQHYEDGKSRVLLVDTQGKLVQQVLTQSGSIRSLAWSSNMRYLAFVLTQNSDQETDASDDRRLNVKDLSTYASPTVLNAMGGAWSPDGDWLAYIENEPSDGLRWKIWAWHIPTNRRLPLARANAPLRSIEWISDRTLGLWATTGYVRDGKYQPALTQGWLLHLAETLHAEMD